MRVGDAEGRVFQGVKWAGGCDVFSRSVKMTERCRRCEREVSSISLVVSLGIEARYPA